MTSAIFGRITCEVELKSVCDACRIKASAFQISFLLNNNDFEYDMANEWEKQVFIANIKTFNKLFGY